MCVCERVCVCVFAQELARACALDHGMHGHVVCRGRKEDSVRERSFILLKVMAAAAGSHLQRLAPSKHGETHIPRKLSPSD